VHRIKRDIHEKRARAFYRMVLFALVLILAVITFGSQQLAHSGPHQFMHRPPGIGATPDAPGKNDLNIPITTNK
jgi:hypothetical protein